MEGEADGPVAPPTSSDVDAGPSRDANWEQRLAQARADRQKALAGRRAEPGSAAPRPMRRPFEEGGPESPPTGKAAMAAASGSTEMHPLMGRPKPWEVGAENVSPGAGEVPPRAGSGGALRAAAPSAAPSSAREGVPGYAKALRSSARTTSSAGSGGKFGTGRAADEGAPPPRRTVSVASVAGVALGLMIGVLGGIALDPFLEPNDAGAVAPSGPGGASDARGPAATIDTSSQASSGDQASAGGQGISGSAPPDAAAPGRSAPEAGPSGGEVEDDGARTIRQEPRGAASDAPQPSAAALPPDLVAPRAVRATLATGVRAPTLAGGAGPAVWVRDARRPSPAAEPTSAEATPMIDPQMALLPAEPGPPLAWTSRAATPAPTWPDGARWDRSIAMGADPVRSGSARSRPVPRREATVSIAASRLAAPSPMAVPNLVDMALRPEAAPVPVTPRAGRLPLAPRAVSPAGATPAWPRAEPAAATSAPFLAAAIVPAGAGALPRLPLGPSVPAAAIEPPGGTMSAWTAALPGAPSGPAATVRMAFEGPLDRTAARAPGALAPSQAEDRIPRAIPAAAPSADPAPPEGRAATPRLPSSQAVAYLVGGSAAERDRLSEGGLLVEVGADAAFPSPRREVRFFHASDAALAEQVARDLDAEVRDFSSFRPAPPEGRIEVRLPAP